ncbi:MAG: HD-like signal output (HDOD) protein/AraC-like DNA-binding protein [Alteromonadaceae bacterium]|jgi:HD-like signal output (HDOD) protein/AraC-like DNA-binding protein
MDKCKQSFKLTEATIALLNKCDFPTTLTIEQCAFELAMSKSSFRRKLVQEETSFKHIQSKFLNELCVQALLTNQVKIDDLAMKLGYAERATFERAFQSKFGLRPSQFRNLAKVGNATGSQDNLTKIAQDMPPMPESCRQLLQERDNDSLDLERVVKVIEQDPIFFGRVMGLASKAIYGYTPKTLHQAISRNLGINTVLNLAVVYAVKDALQEHVEPNIIEQYTKAFIIAPTFFKQIRKSAGFTIKLDIALTEQILTFGLLGIFLLSHKKTNNYQLMLHSLLGIDELSSLNNHVKQFIGSSIYSISSLMLSLWHIEAGLIKQLTHLDKVSQQKTTASKQDELILFMLSCLYAFSKGDVDFNELAEKAELLNIQDFFLIKTQIFNAD